MRAASIVLVHTISYRETYYGFYIIRKIINLENRFVSSYRVRECSQITFGGTWGKRAFNAESRKEGILEKLTSFFTLKNSSFQIFFSFFLNFIFS